MSSATPKLSEKVVEILLSAVHADYEWNCRRIAGKEETAADGAVDGKDQVNEFDALKSSLRSRGQDQAVIVRPRGKGYALVVGFRRFKALQEIAEEDKNTKTATVKAIIRELNDVEAKSLNIRENTARKDLPPTDLCKSLIDLRELYVKAKGAPTITALADEVGLGRAYASKLFSIADKATPKVLKQWFEAPAAIGVVKMTEVIKVEKDRQEEAFQALLPQSGRGKGGGRKAWLKGAENEAKRVGTFLGTLERKGLISTDGLDFEVSLEDCIKMGQGDAKATEKQRAELVKVISEAYEAAMNPAPKEEKVKGGKDKSAAKDAKDAAAAN